MRTLHILSISCLLAAAALAQPGAPVSTLKVGDEAPDFTLPSTTGQQIHLTDYRGKKNVVLAFFPAAFTGGCTKEMQAYQLDLSKFEGNETQVFAISTDNTPSQKEFAAKLNVTFPILSDFFDRKVSTAYGVLMPARGMDNRVTFVIAKDGKIAFMEQGKTDTTGSSEACNRLAHRSSTN